MATYSFSNVQASITGPGGTIQMGNGSATAEEGITTEPTERNTMTTGSDGSVMHSLHAAKPGKITVRLLKTSPVNAALSQMQAFQMASSATHGQNVITVTDPVRGDVVTGIFCAFKKPPNLTYAVEGGMNEWEFDVGQIDELLGSGVPDINV